jgi:hypothetical protein
MVMASEDVFGAVFAREQSVERMAQDIVSRINGADPELALAAIARAASMVAARGSTPGKPIRPQIPPKAMPAPTPTRAEKTPEPPAEGRTTTLVECLTAQRGMPIGDLAEYVYGSRDRQAQGKVRSLLAALKNAGRANNYEPGKWEVTG